MILALKTDSPEAMIALYEDGNCIGTIRWQAHKELSSTLLGKIDELLLAASNVQKTDLTGIVVFKGPGSFTGLRIGITVANTLAYSLQIPIVGTEGEEWIAEGLQKLTESQKAEIIIPHYGSEAHITQPRK